MKTSLSSKAVLSSEEFYNDAGKQYEDAFGHDPGLLRIDRKFLDLLLPDARVLDCGSGTGKPTAHMIAESGRAVYGIDQSKTMVELSKEQVPDGSFETVNMVDYTPATDFGGIVAMLSLFELSREEITSMACKWFKWLQPGGYLLIGVFGAEDCTTSPAMYDSDGQCASGIDFVFMNHRVKMTLFTKAGWKHLLESSGFEIVHEETDVFSPPPATVCDDEPHYFVIARKPPSK